MTARQLTRGIGRDAVRRLVSSTTGTARVWALTAVLAAIALAIASLELPAGPPAQAPVALPWWLLAAVFYVTETTVIHLHIGRSAHSFSMSEVPLILGLFFLDPGAVPRRPGSIGAGLALVISRRQRSVKLAFNLSQFMLARWSHSSVSPPCLVRRPGRVLRRPTVVIGRLACRWRTYAENFVGVLAVTAAISLAEGRSQFRPDPRDADDGRRSWP